MHHRQEAAGSLTGLGETAIFVKEGFSWPAFFFPLIWLLYKRMWIVLAFYVVATTAMAILAETTPVSDDAVFLCNLAVSLILGLEGNDLYRWTLARRRYREQAVVIGSNQVTAEQRYFDAAANAIRQFRAPAAMPSSPQANLAGEANLGRHE